MQYAVYKQEGESDCLPSECKRLLAKSMRRRATPPSPQTAIMLCGLMSLWLLSSCSSSSICTMTHETHVNAAVHASTMPWPFSADSTCLTHTHTHTHTDRHTEIDRHLHKHRQTHTHTHTHTHTNRHMQLGAATGSAMWQLRATTDHADGSVAAQNSKR